MGLLGLLGEVITEFKADVSDMKAGLEELTAAERLQAETELAQAEARNEHADHFIESLAKIGLAIAAVKEVGDILWDGYKDGLKEARLETAAAGVDIERLSEAAGGLKTNMQLLEFAAKAHTGAFKLNTEQLEIAEKAMRTLTERGYDATEVQNAFTEALVSGRVRGLEQFGIVIDKTGLQMDEHGVKMDTLQQKGELVSRMFKAIGADAEQAGKGEGAVGEEGEKAATQLTNAWDKLKIAIGQLVIELQPLISGLADVLGVMYKIIDAGKSARERAAADTDRGIHAWDDVQTKSDVSMMNAAKSAARAEFVQQTGRLPDKDLLDRQDDLGEWAKNNWVDPDLIEIDKTDLKTKKQTGPSDEDILARYNERQARLFDVWSKWNDERKKKANQSDVGLLGISAGTETAFGSDEDVTVQGTLDSNENKRIKGLTDDWNKQLGKNRTERDSLLKRTFGPVGEFDLYKKGFDALTGAVGNMYDAIVSGSEPAGKAFQKMIGQSVEGVGKQMTVEALKEGAYAIASLASYQYAAAAEHGEAAAGFAAGAVVAGLVASELGYGSGSGGSGGGGGAGGGGPASSSGGASGASTPSNQTAPVIIVMNDPQAGSLRQKQAYAQQMMQQAVGGSGVRNG